MDIFKVEIEGREYIIYPQPEALQIKYEVYFDDLLYTLFVTIKQQYGG